MTLKYLKAVRTRYRNTIEREIQESKMILSANVEQVDRKVLVDSASKCSEKLKLYSEKLEFQSGKLASVIEEEGGDIDTIIEQDDVLCSKAMDSYSDLSNFKERLVDSIKNEDKSDKGSEFSVQIVELQKERKDLIQKQVMCEQNKQTGCSVKLPKLELHSFSGDKTKWNEFWDSVEGSVHKNTKLTNIEKFNYLCSKLYGEAKRALSGISLTSDNYIVAVQILEERFGNKQDMIDIHYNKLINIKAASNKTSSLQEFIDTFTKHIRSLEVLK